MFLIHDRVGVLGALSGACDVWHYSMEMKLSLKQLTIIKHFPR